jgi:hypothetical protein
MERHPDGSDMASASVTKAPATMPRWHGYQHFGEGLNLRLTTTVESGKLEICVIENIECFCPKLEGHAFCQAKGLEAETRHPFRVGRRRSETRRFFISRFGQRI